MTLDDFKTWRPVLKRARDVSSYAQTMFQGFDDAFDAAPYRIRLRIAGTVFEIASDLPEKVTLAQHSLAGTPTRDTASARLLISGLGELPGLPAVPVWEDHCYNDHRLCQKFEPTDLRLYHYRERDFWQFYERVGNRGVQLMASRLSFPDWDSGSPLRNLLRWHLTTPEQGFVHAGTLGDNGTGLMLAGPGGSGKSGTVLAGLMAGMQSVGDDYVLARAPSEGGVSVAPVFASLKNDPEGMVRLGIKMDGLGHINWQGKHQFTFKELVQRDPDPELKIKALCVPTVTGSARTTITQMGRRDAYLALSQTGFKQMPGDTRHSLTFCSELIRRLPAYRLSLGTEPGEIIDTLREFLAQPHVGEA